ncbi:sulfoquinovosidase-like, partial [Anneissia japonica]|uniref:sulfoquinovosidase-like n=1 Tax=Anneissia japonica TaxID=1529436 RepID=UPI0014258999
MKLYSFLLNSMWLLVYAFLTGTLVSGTLDYTLNEQNELDVYYNGIHLIKHSDESPFLYLGSGKLAFKSHHGNFEISDYVEERIGLNDVMVQYEEPDEIEITFKRGTLSLRVTLTNKDGLLDITFGDLPSGMDRLWFRIKADPEEYVYGAGEQFSYFNMKGQTFPIWTREQGVGRNKSTYATFEADNSDGGGGDYHTTYWAQPTFVSSKKYFLHSSVSSYVGFDFRHKDFHEVFISSLNPGHVAIRTANSFIELVSMLTNILGRQPVLPDWIHSGIILGVQGGTASMLEYLKMAEDQGVRVSGLWIQDWVGRITTSFGRRLFWNWE